MRTLRRTAPAALAVVAAVLLGACGGGGDSGGVATLSRSEGESAAAAADDAPTEEDVLKWVECMREQGIDVADPAVDSDGMVVLGGGPRVVVGGPGTASSPSSASSSGSSSASASTEPPDRDAFENARETCGDPPRAGGSFSEQDRQAFQDAALELARCMRDQGIDFPDPVVSDAGPGGPVAGTAEAADEGERPGPFRGAVDMDDPEVQAAFETCRAEVGDALPGPMGVQRAAPAGGAG